MPKYFRQEGGAVPLLLLLTAVGLMAFLFISNTFNFKDRLFNTLFPKPSSSAKEITQEPPQVEDELLVKFKPGLAENKKTNLRKLYGLDKKAEIAQIGVETVKVNPQAKEKVLQALKKHKEVEYVEPNYILKPSLIPNDPAWADEWNLKKVSADIAWDISTGSSSAIVAVTDTGVRLDHEDLVGKILPGYNFYSNNTDVTDTDGHGTAMVGIVGAITNNGKGVASLGFNTPILPIKIAAPDGSATYTALANAIIYAADHGAKVVSTSYGAGAPSTTMENAINYAWNKGLVLAAAAGNSNTSPIEYPAAEPNELAVGATTGDDTKSNFSNYGTALDLVAPGLGVYSTCNSSTNCYAPYSGTSPATPHVAALAVLVFAANPNLTPAQVVDILEKSADDLGDPGWDQYFGWGRINAARALQQATGTTGALPDRTSPQIKWLAPTEATVSGTINVAADVTDNVGVTRVDFGYCNATTSVSVPPYSILWDTTTAPNGYCNLSINAYDAAGNIGSQSGPRVRVLNPSSDITPPTVSVTAPPDGTTVSGKTALIHADAADNVGVLEVSFFIDGVFWYSISLPYSGNATFGSYSGPYWDTTQYSNGSHTIHARALDTSNNLGESSIVTVTVNNPTPPTTPTPTPTPLPTPTPTPLPTPIPADIIVPTVTITSPLNGATVTKGSNVTIQATATDNVGVSKVDFYVNGVLVGGCSDTTSPYSCSWKVPKAGGKNSTYTIKATATDTSNNSSSNSISVTSK